MCRSGFVGVRVGPAVGVGAEPTLVEVAPGVWAIEDNEEPVFYADGYYWAYRDDVWFRSSVHTGGWLRVSAAPRVIVTIGNPHAYTRYRGRAGVHVRRGLRGTVVVRDHRR